MLSRLTPLVAPVRERRSVTAQAGDASSFTPLRRRRSLVARPAPSSDGRENCANLRKSTLTRHGCRQKFPDRRNARKPPSTAARSHRVFAAAPTSWKRVDASRRTSSTHTPIAAGARTGHSGHRAARARVFATTMGAPMFHAARRHRSSVFARRSATLKSLRITEFFALPRAAAANLRTIVRGAARDVSQCRRRVHERLRSSSQRHAYAVSTPMTKASAHDAEASDGRLRGATISSTNGRVAATTCFSGLRATRGQCEPGHLTCWIF